MAVEAWLAFCLTETLLCFTPGPAVLLVLSVAAARGVRPGMRAALGVLATNTLYFALSGVGVGAAPAASHELAGAFLVGAGARHAWVRSE